MELCDLDGITYASVDGELPEYDARLVVAETELTTLLRDRIKTESTFCQLIAERMQSRIRERYSQEDEHYLTRISVGAISGLYTMEPGEMDQVVAFSAFVESVRQWGRDERGKVGL